MPSSKFIDLTLGANGSQYTAPANGWFLLDKRGDSGTYVRLVPSYGTFTGSYTSNRGNEECFSSCPVKKGDIVTAVYTAGGDVSVFRFIYAQGSESEAN